MKPEIRKPTEQEKQMAQSWPVWEKEVSEFPWEYAQQETCLLIQGKVNVINEKGENFQFQAGDWVVFPQGMKCTWKITEDVKKHYKFG